MTTSRSISTRLCAAALVGTLSCATALAAPAVALSGPSSVVSGGSLQLGVTASGFTDLFAYQFDITFNPAVFNATGVAAGSFLAGAGSTFFDGGVIDNATGTISFVFNSVIGAGSGVSGTGNLAQLNFRAVGTPYTGGSFAIANFAAYDSALNPIGAAMQGMSVSVSPVPEPSVLSLALVAMGGFFLRRLGQARLGGAKAAANA